MKSRNIILAIVFLAFVSSFSPTIYAQPELDIRKYSNHNLPILEREADMLYLQKSYAEVAKLFLQIVDQNLDNGDIYYKLSRCYFYLKKPALSADFLIIAINNGFIDYQLIKADVAFNGIRKNVHFKSTYNEVLNYGRNLGDKILYVDAQKKIKSRVFLPDNYDANKYTILGKKI